MTNRERVEKALKEFNDSPEGFEMTLRLDLALMIIKRLDKLGWSQRKLAKKTGFTVQHICYIVNSDRGCSLKGIGKICHALGIEPRLRVQRK